MHLISKSFTSTADRGTQRGAKPPPSPPKMHNNKPVQPRTPVWARWMHPVRTMPTWNRRWWNRFTQQRGVSTSQTESSLHTRGGSNKQGSLSETVLESIHWTYEGFPEFTIFLVPVNFKRQANKSPVKSRRVVFIKLYCSLKQRDYRQMLS